MEITSFFVNAANTIWYAILVIVALIGLIFIIKSKDWQRKGWGIIMIVITCTIGGFLMPQLPFGRVMTGTDHIDSMTVLLAQAPVNSLVMCPDSTIAMIRQDKTDQRYICLDTWDFDRFNEVRWSLLTQTRVVAIWTPSDIKYDSVAAVLVRQHWQKPR